MVANVLEALPASISGVEDAGKRFSINITNHLQGYTLSQKRYWSQVFQKHLQQPAKVCGVTTQKITIKTYKTIIHNP
jgi:hypothetical protein